MLEAGSPKRPEDAKWKGGEGGRAHRRGVDGEDQGSRLQAPQPALDLDAPEGQKAAQTEETAGANGSDPESGKDGEKEKCR